VHAPTPPVLYWPVGQAEALALVDPGWQKYPAAHAPLHWATPMAGVAPKRPAGHGVHIEEPASEYWPAGQALGVGDEDPGGQTYPWEHNWHAPQPAYENWPPAHRFGVGDVEPAGQKYPAEHGPWPTALVAPVVEYRPALTGPLQSREIKRGPSPYRPGGHPEHCL
jgi:hypothetical protein